MIGLYLAVLTAFPAAVGLCAPGPMRTLRCEEEEEAEAAGFFFFSDFGFEVLSVLPLPAAAAAEEEEAPAALPPPTAASTTTLPSPAEGHAASRAAQMSLGVFLWARLSCKWN